MSKKPDEVKGGSGIWIGVAVIFGLMALAWAVMFFFATKHRPATVPIEPRSER